MTLDQGQLLYEYQTAFEASPSNMDSAYKLFRELNKHGMHLSVIRLYWKHELKKQYKYNSNSKSAQYMQSQYEYARDHVTHLQSMGSQDSNRNEGAYNGQSLLERTLLALAQLVPVLVCFYYISESQEFRGKSKMYGDQKFEFKTAGDIPTRLDDVKGIDEIRDEIQNLIKMIKNPEEYSSKGAKMHKGVLLFGKPGTGKTLLSRAIAGEAGVSFLYCTGSSFDEMFVGVGAKRVRELFEQARKNRPCIIFIDEIDTLLSSSRRFGNEHSSSRATINQMLTEMDGFQQNDGILVIGATNHQDSLDPAAVRPGRFDKKIHVPTPDIKGREDIFKIYLDKIEYDKSIEVKKLATMAPGFTGAEIENLVNTAILQAVHQDKEKADMDDFEFARDRIMMGIERKKLSMSEKERLNTAIHEAGHTVACYYTKSAQKLYKATIVARGGSLGATFMVPDESSALNLNKEKVIANIDVAMGGHCAEELFIGKDQVTTGCGSDLTGATNYADMAVSRFSMFGEEAGFQTTDKKQMSEERRALIDREVKKILNESKARVEKLLKKHEKEVRDITVNLYKYDYLNQEEIETIMNGKPLDKKGVREFDPKIADYVSKF